MKNKFLLIVLAIAILIPSVVAIVNYNAMQTAPADSRTAVSITVNDINGNQYYLEKKKDGDEADKTIDMFLSMIDNASKMVALPDQLMGTPTYLVTIATTVTESKYKFYFSDIPGTNYFTTEEGGAYHVASKDAEAFLETKYAASVFPGAKLPTLILSEQHPVKPSTATWNYSVTDGSFLAVDTTPALADKTSTYVIENGFTLDFSVDPDYLMLKITDASSGTEYFNDYYSNLSSLSITNTTSVVVDVTAKWYQTEDSTYYGEMTYKFNTDISAPASFILSTTGVSIEPGEFVGITALNVSDVSKISFSATPAIDYRPVFVKNGDNAYAFLPLGVDLAAGNYTLKLSYGGVTQELKLTVTAKTFGNSWANYTAADYNTYYTDSVMKEAADELAPYLTYYSATQRWDGAFTEGIVTNYVDYSAYLVSGFGRYMYVMKDGVETGEMFRHEGVDYAAVAGTDVTAVNGGEVTYAGFVDFWGYIVIVEHGYGLKSWYCNMGSIDVKAGDLLAKGDKIGEVGKTGLAFNQGVHIGMSIFGEYVSPYDVQTYGFTFKTKAD